MQRGGLTPSDWILNASTLVYVVALIGIAPYLSRQAVALGASEREVSFLATSYAVTAISLRLLVGSLSDRGFAKTLMFIGGLVGSLAFLTYSQASAVPHLYVGRLLQGVSVALFIPASLYSATVGDRERASAVIMWRSTMWGLGSALGPLVFGYLLQSFSWAMACYAGAALSLASSFTSLSMEKRAQRGHGDSNGSIFTPGFIAASATLFLYVIAYQSMFFFLPALHEAMRYPQDQTSLLFASLAGFNLVARLGISLIKPRSPAATAALGIAVSSVGYSIIAMNPTGPLSLLGAAVLGAGFGSMVPSLQVISLLSVPEGRRGFASSVYTATFDVASLIGPPTVIAIAGEYERSLYLSAGISALSILPVLSFMARRSKDMDRQK